MAAKVEIDENYIENHSFKLTDCGCWIWMSSLDDKGRGRVTNGNGSNTGAHRASWKAFNGEIPVGLFVLHKCDVGCCVNPKHLFLGTQLDNMKDMRKKGRNNDIGPRGEKAFNSKLTANEVLAIRTSVEKSKKDAEKYGVSPGHIRSIKSGKKWAHI